MGRNGGRQVGGFETGHLSGQILSRGRPSKGPLLGSGPGVGPGFEDRLSPEKWGARPVPWANKKGGSIPHTPSDLPTTHFFTSLEFCRRRKDEEDDLKGWWVSGSGVDVERISGYPPSSKLGSDSYTQDLDDFTPCTTEISITR